MTLSKYTWQPFQEATHDAKALLTQVERALNQRDPGEGYAAYAWNRTITKPEHYHEAAVLYAGEVPIGFYILELTSATYGSMSCYVTHVNYAAHFVTESIKKGVFKDVILEIVPLPSEDTFSWYYLQAGLMPNVRKRMYCWTSKLDPACQMAPREGCHFKPYTAADLAVTAPMSVAAHTISNDYPHYDAMQSVSKRHTLDQRVLDGQYGRVIQEASVVLYAHDQLVGYTVVVEVEACWGFKRVPWVFDICIQPTHHGKGLGRYLFHHMMVQLKACDYPIVGLSATVNNWRAIDLYKQAGFQDLDVFYEFKAVESSSCHSQ